jgi:hypothetical protein
VLSSGVLNGTIFVSPCVNDSSRTYAVALFRLTKPHTIEK